MAVCTRSKFKGNSYKFFHMISLTRHTALVLPFLSVLTAIGILGISSSARAAFLLDPSGGTILLSSSTGDPDKDDGVALATHGFNGSFFGYALNGIKPLISVNGFLSFGSSDEDGDRLVALLGSVEDRSRIVPMWQNFKLGTAGQVVESIGSSYYAVSWRNLEADSYSGYANFQAIFIEGATTISGNNFLAGDIVFSYGDIGIYSTINEVVIGLEDYGSIATLPGAEAYSGHYSRVGFGDFPVGANQYLLFRPDGYGYDSSIVTAIPEPATNVLLAASGLMLLGGVLWRRRSE